MRGDFTRLTFRRGKHYSDVLHQQGRVWLDSDWNEQVFDRLDLLEQETIDVIGGCGVPTDHFEGPERSELGELFGPRHPAEEIRDACVHGERGIAIGGEGHGHPLTDPAVMPPTSWRSATR